MEGNLKNAAAKTVSLLLILFGFYQMFLSLQAIFLIYPQLSLNLANQPLIFQEGLMEKGLILYVTMVVDGVYGISLLFKPARKIEIIHIVIGFLIAVVSVFYISKTPWTTDPAQQFLSKLLEGY